MVFLLGVIGFGIALMGLFNDDSSGFPNVKVSFFTLFASGMGKLFINIKIIIQNKMRLILYLLFYRKF